MFSQDNLHDHLAYVHPHPLYPESLEWEMETPEYRFHLISGHEVWC